MAKSTRRTPDAEAHYVSPRKKRAKPPLKLQPPLTPMIDVTFQLLLFFLLTTTFRQAEGQIPGTLPKMGTATVQKPDVVPLEKIVIRIKPTGEFRLGALYEVGARDTAIRDPRSLYEELEGMKKQTSDESPVEIEPRADVRWEFVLQAYNQAVRAKFKNIGFKI